MRELSPDIVKQLLEQLEKVRAGEGATGSSEAREAMLEAVFLVAAADGKVTPLEIAQFAEAVEGIPDERAHAIMAEVRADLFGD